MLLPRLAMPALLLLLTALSASAASFDCAQAKTPFEHAICDIPDLSLADERLARTFATATGGLSKPATALMWSSQRDWLDFAQRACTDDAKPLASGSYDTDAGSCLIDLFNSRSTALEQSRMLAGHRFLVQDNYGAVPDPNEADNPDSFWKVASYDLTYPMLDSDDPLSGPFNDYVSKLVAEMSPAQGVGQDRSSDTSISISLKEVAGTNRITLEETSYWFGHGAAHGNYSINYLHYYVPEQRGVIASDIFTGDDWETTLADAAWAQLQAQHKDWLQVESASDIAELVVDPTRWDLSDDYGLIIQFQPYEVAAYAYGSPTITIPWDSIDAIKADTQEAVRYGN